MNATAWLADALPPRGAVFVLFPCPSYRSSSNGTSWATRIRYYGYRGGWIGENLAVGNVTARTVMAMWKASPPHRANLLNCAAKSVGVGAVYAANGTPYYTQDFGSK